MKHKLFTAILIASSFALTACDGGVPHVTDPENIIVDGRPMAQGEFVNKYCGGKVDNESCVLVRRAISKSSTKSKSGVPTF